MTVTRRRNFERLLRPDSYLVHRPQRAAQRSALSLRVPGKLHRQTPALAVVGLRKVDQFEIEGEGPSQPIGLVRIKGVDTVECDCEQPLGFRLPIGALPRREAVILRLAPPDGDLAQLFFFLEEPIARLFPQHLA